MINNIGNTIRPDGSPKNPPPGFSPPPLGELSQVTFLVVDDVQDNVDLVKTMLTKSGFTKIVTANSGREALEYLQHHDKNGDGAIDMMLLDIMMPEMDGWQVCQFMRNHQDLAEIPVIMITADTTLQHQALHGSYACNPTEIMFKPIRRMELIPRVMSALSLKK